MAFDPSTAQLDGFDPSTAKPVESRGAMAEIGTAAVRGLYTGVKGAGSIMQAPAEMGRSEPGIVSRAGKHLEEFGKAGEERNKAQPETHGGVTNFLSTAAESLGGSLPVVAGAMAGGAAGSVLPGPGNIVGAAAGGAGAAGLQTWHEKYQEGREKGLGEEQARDYAGKSAALSGAAMGALSAIPGGGAAARTALGAGAKSAAEAGAEAVGKKFAPEMAKQAAGIAGGNTALGIGQAAAQAKIDESEGLKGPSAWEAAKAAAMPSLAGSVGFLPLGALHAHHEAAQAAKFKAALENGDAHPLARARAANAVFESMQKVDENAAEAWKANALEAMKRKAPIGLTDDWTRPNAELFPELKLLPAPKAIAAGEGAPEQPGAGSQEELANQKRWEERDAAEAARNAGMNPQPAGLLENRNAPEQATPPLEPNPGPLDAAMEGHAAQLEGQNNAMWAARDAEEQRRTEAQANAPQWPPSKPELAGLLENRNAPLDGTNALEPNPGPSAPIADAHAQQLVQRNDAMWQRREAHAQQIEQAGNGGTLSMAAGQAVRSGAADESTANRAAAEPTKPAKQEEVTGPRAHWAQVQQPMPLADAQRMADSMDAAGEGRAYGVAPHPEGGYMVLPAEHAEPGLRRAGQVPPQERQLPLERAAADQRAQQLTTQHGVEHEVVPHPLAREKFGVQPKASSTEREQPQESNNGIPVPGDHTQVPEGTQAGIRQGEGGPGSSAGTGPDGSPHAAEGEEASRLFKGNAAGLHEGVAGHIERLVAEPSTVAQRRTGARAPDADEGMQIHAALQHLEGSGADTSRLSSVSGIHVSDDVTRQGAYAAYYPETGGVAVSPALLQTLRNDPSGHKKLAKIIDHEVWHNADHTEEGRAAGTEAFHSTHDPRFEITHEGDPVGALAVEAVGAHEDPENPFRTILNYPLESRRDVRKYGDEEEFRAIMQNELFAQLGMIYNAYPEQMLRHLPQAYQLFKEIHDGKRQEGSLGRAYVRSIERAAGAGREGSVRENGGRAPEGRADHAGLSAAAGGDGRPRFQRADERDGRPGDAGEVQRRAGAAREAPLEGAPRTSPGPSVKAREVAEQYMKEAGLPYTPPTKFVTVDRAHAKRIADAYEAMPHAPNDPAVKRAYDALIKETAAQWEAVKRTGLKVEFASAEHPYPYKTPNDTFRDVNENNHLWVFPTTDGFGGSESAHIDVSGNPLLRPTGEEIGGYPLVANDQFRIVHDYFGHIKDGNGFRANGEENAWRAHAAMFTPEARKALTSETRGQNSWVNWGPFGEKNRVASQEETQYAPQKTGLLPQEFVEDHYEPTPARFKKGSVELEVNHHSVNIGLDVPGSGEGLTQEHALKALRDLGVKVEKTAVHASNTEPTLVAHIDRALTKEEAHRLSEVLKQDAIAHVSNAKGELYGPKAEQWGPFRPDFYLTHEGKRMSEVGPSGDETVSTRNPTAMNRTEHPLVQRTDVSYDAMARDPKLLAHNVGVMHEYPNFARKTALKDTRQLAERMVKQMVDSLLWLHDQVSPEIRDRSKLWYDGAHKIANDWAAELGIPRRAAAGVLASLSPQKDWFMNVSLARRVIDTLAKQKETPWSPEMTQTAERILKLDEKKWSDVYAKINGKQLGELNDDFLKAVWIRVYDESHNDRSYHIINPEGSKAGLAMNEPNKKGEIKASTAAWGDFNSISKAVSIFENPSVQNIHDQLGNEHKVRSFYNNIVDPKSHGEHVTIDTHAVAAALLRPLSGTSTEVLHNFGSTVPAERGVANAKGSSLTGISGTYGIYAEAYRRAAEARGILPREMQSITWEAVRGLFKPSFKTGEKRLAKAGGLGTIDAIWKDYAKGKYDLTETRERIKAAAGGITPPDWVSSAGLHDQERGRVDARELPRADVPGQRAGERAGAATAVPKRRALGAGASFDLAGPDGDRPGAPVRPISSAKGMPDWVKSLPEGDREALRKAGVWVQTKSLSERWAEYKKDAGLKILQGTVDQFRPVLERIGEYPYKLLRMASSSSGALEASLRNGHIEMTDWGALAIKRDTKGLLETLKPLGAETDRFLAWIAGNRAAALAAEGREHNFTPAEIASLRRLNMKLHDGDAWTGEGTRAQTYAQTLKEWNAYSKSILDIAEKSGLIDGEGRKAWESDFYVPFYRAAEKSGPEGGNISGMVNKQAFKKLKGGEEELKDLLANSLGNWAHLLDASMRNNAAWQTLQHAADKGIAQRIKEAESAKGDVFVMQDGKKQYYRVSDPLVLDAVSSLSAVPFKGPVMKALTSMKSVLTHGVTMSPTFRVRNVIRDQVSALAVNDMSANFVKNIVEGVKYSSKDNPEYAQMQAAGAFMHLAHNADNGYAEHVKRLIAEGVDKATILDSPNKVSAMFKHAYEWWEETGERSESLTRATIYKQAYAKAIEAGHPPERASFEAAYAARDAMDFGLRGTWSSVRMLTQVVPFLNARLQGLYKLGRGADQMPARFAAVVGGVTLATIALGLANYGDKEIENLPDSDHNDNWIFRVGDAVYRIPKPFEVGALATVVERGLRVALDGFKPSDREMFVQRLGQIVGSQLNMNPIPQAIWPAVQLWANKDFFRGTAIESSRDQKLTPAQRIGANTSATAQLLGKNDVISPEQIDFLVNAYFGWVGTHAMATADLALRPAMGLPAKAARRVDDYFMVGDFVHQLPSNQSRFVEQFYDHLKEVQQAMGDLRALQQTGQTQAAADYARKHKDQLALNAIYTRTQREIAVLNRRQRYVQMRTEASGFGPEEKRRELDRIAQLKLRLSESVESHRAATLDRQQ
jgi:hypothetical protein